LSYKRIISHNKPSSSSHCAQSVNLFTSSVVERLFISLHFFEENKISYNYSFFFLPTTNFVIQRRIKIDITSKNYLKNIIQNSTLTIMNKI
jgi:hypothetical protein